MALEDGKIIIHDKTYVEYLSAVIECFYTNDEVKMQFTKSARKMDIATKIESRLYPLGIRSRPRTTFTIKSKTNEDIPCEEQKLYKIPILKENMFA